MFSHLDLTLAINSLLLYSSSNGGGLYFEHPEAVNVNVSFVEMSGLFTPVFLDCEEKNKKKEKSLLSLNTSTAVIEC